MNKAEKHEIRQWVRGERHLMPLTISNEVSAIRRVIFAELRKRKFDYDNYRRCWVRDVKEPDRNRE